VGERLVGRQLLRRVQNLACSLSRLVLKLHTHMSTEVDTQKRHLNRIIDTQVSLQTVTDVVASVERINLGAVQSKGPKKQEPKKQGPKKQGPKKKK
jgi:hypothetical protein